MFNGKHPDYHITVNSTEELIHAQLYLFESGYRWSSDEYKLRTLINKPLLNVDKVTNIITFSSIEESNIQKNTKKYKVKFSWDYAINRFIYELIEEKKQFKLIYLKDKIIAVDVYTNEWLANILLENFKVPVNTKNRLNELGYDTSGHSWNKNGSLIFPY